MYPEDFNTADAAYAPVSDGLFVGVSPLLLVLGALLLAGAALLGWWLGRSSARGERGDEAAPAEIHKAILATSSAAMAASSNELKARAQTLRDRISDLLGPVLEVAKGVSPAVKALDEALKGEKKIEVKSTEPKKPDASPPPPCGCGKPDACTCRSTAVTVNQVYIGGAPVSDAPSCGCKGSHAPGCNGDARPAPPSPAKAETVAMTGAEQVEALARAVRQFHDHWLDGPARVRELKAARAALSRRPPASQTKTHGH